MDNLRGFDSLEPAEEQDTAEYAHFEDNAEDAGIEAPPIVSGDERRMQVRAYNFWTGQLGDRSYPAVEDLEPDSHDDFRDFSVLLDFTSGIENPSIPYIGQKLRDACELAEGISYLDQVPARSLLSRITDHYMQIIANRAPIGFEAEYENDQNVTIMYRGILLPYSSDDDTIDFIYGVINWKEVADDEIVQEIQNEVTAALENPPPPHQHVDAWDDLPAAAEIGNPDTSEVGSDAILELRGDLSVANTEPDEDSSLADWLVSARNMADAAKEADLRGRDALYRAVGRAWDFALISRDNASDYAEILEDSGIEVQERAPMTPIVKLIFGVDYDKTRLTEFATALTYASNNNIGRGQFAEFIGNYDGGLKGIVQAERRARKVARGEHVAVAEIDPRVRLRGAKLRDLTEFAGQEGDEFVILVARRGSDGSLALVGQVDGGKALTEKALKKTVIKEA